MTHGFYPWLLVALLAVPASAAHEASSPIRHGVLLMEYEHGHCRLVQVAADGKMQWEHAFVFLSVMFQRLPNGHIVCPHDGPPAAGVTELDADHKPVWEYQSHALEILGCERLADGSTLVGEQGPCRAVFVDPRGEVLRAVAMTAAGQPHRQVRRLHLLDNGDILAAHEEDGAIREYDRTGKIVWEYKGLENPFEAVRLSSGNTLIGCGTQKRVIEVTPEQKVVWELKSDEAPELNLAWITSLQVLPNGHYVIANFLRGHEGKGAHAFEVTREKKIVWQFADHQMVKSLTMLQVLD